MKHIFTLFIIFSFLGCASYTDPKFFNCSSAENYKRDSDKKELIYKILKRAVVEEKDVPDSDLIKDKQKIYIENVYYGAFLGNEAKKTFPINSSEIPSEINGVSFCLKSKAEMQKIADKTSAFLYLNFAQIKIVGDIATIGISTNWQPTTNSKVVYLSGGGYVWQFKKINEKWEFDKILSQWVS